MQLTSLVPQDVLAADAAASSLLSALVARTTFVPWIAFQLGWRGLDAVRRDPPAWTARVQGRQGIYGLAHEVDRRHGCTSIAFFGLHNFPLPDDDLVERLPLRAALLTGRPGYVEEGRRFVDHADYLGLFRIATIAVAADVSRPSLSIAIDAETRLRTIASDGVSLTVKGRELLSVIEPGGTDEDFPAFDVSLPFFDVLAATVAAGMREEPAALVASQCPGTEWVYDRNGEVTALRCIATRRRRIALHFGDSPDPDPAGEGDRRPGSLVWRRGEPLPAEFAMSRWWHAPALCGMETLEEPS